MTRITVKDFRACGVCPDAANWFRAVGLDWRDFVRNGIEAEELRATGDHLDLINRLEAAARERENGGR
ncbi:thioredoxin domain-containing protein [Halovulum sp. GXIMD14793]